MLGSEHTRSLDLDFLGWEKAGTFVVTEQIPACVSSYWSQAGLVRARVHARTCVCVCVWGVGGRQGWGPAN